MPRRFLFSPWKSGVAEPNGNVRIFYGKLQRSSLCTCSVQNWPKTAPNEWHDIAWPQVAVHLQWPHFRVISCGTCYCMLSCVIHTLL